MGIIGGVLADAVLSRFEWEDTHAPVAYRNRSKLEVLFGPDIWTELDGKSVIDYGCGTGEHAVEICRRSPLARVIGIDIREEQLRVARRRASEAGVAARCSFFSYSPRIRADIILSIDSFEHFTEPAKVLQDMSDLLWSEGRVWISFGPPWLHPKGSHFPGPVWSNLLFTEQALMQWRARFKRDGAKKFEEIEGGLNRMTIRRFEQVVPLSGFEFESLELVPIQRVRWLHNRLTREFLTSVVRAKVKRREPAVAELRRSHRASA